MSEVLEVVTQAKAGIRKVAQTITRLVKAGVCLVCAKKEGKAKHRRGLCGACYQQYRIERARMNELEQERFDADLISRGQLLPLQGVRTVKKKSVFHAAAQAAKKRGRR